MSQKYSRTESRILGALSRLDDFFLNPLIQGYSGTAPETSRNTVSTNQGTNQGDSQSDPHPEVGVSQSQTTNSGPGDTYDSYCENHRKKKLPNYARKFEHVGKNLSQTVKTNLLGVYDEDLLPLWLEKLISCIRSEETRIIQLE